MFPERRQLASKFDHQLVNSLSLFIGDFFEGDSIELTRLVLIELAQRERGKEKLTWRIIARARDVLVER